MLRKWAQIHDMQKEVFGWPEWRLCSVSRPSKKSQQKLNSSLASRQEILVNLCDRNGLNLQAVQVKIIAPLNGAQSDVTAILQVSDYDWTTIA